MKALPVDVPAAHARPRAALLAPFTALEAEVCRLLGQGLVSKDVAHRLAMTTGSVKVYAAKVARKIPGTGPARVRIVMWWRGCSLDQLRGDTQCK